MSGFLQAQTRTFRLYRSAMDFRRSMISRRAAAGSARTRLLPAWIARGSLPTNEFSSLPSIEARRGTVPFSSNENWDSPRPRKLGQSPKCRRSDPTTAGRRKRTLAAIMRTPISANAVHSGSRLSVSSVTPGKIGSSRASTGIAARVAIAALVGAAGRQVDRRNVCQAGQARRREHCRFSLCQYHLNHSTHPDGARQIAFIMPTDPNRPTASAS